MCKRWVGDWTNCNILTPSSFVFSSTSFSFCWAAQSGVLRALSPLLGAGSLQLLISNSLTPKNLNCLSLRVIPLFAVHLLPVSVAYASNSSRPRSRLYLDVFVRIHLFLDWRLGRRSICYRESLMCHKTLKVVTAWEISSLTSRLRQGSHSTISWSWSKKFIHWICTGS